MPRVRLLNIDQASEFLEVPQEKLVEWCLSDCWLYFVASKNDRDEDFLFGIADLFQFVNSGAFRELMMRDLQPFIEEIERIEQKIINYNNQPNANPHTSYH